MRQILHYLFSNKSEFVRKIIEEIKFAYEFFLVILIVIIIHIRNTSHIDYVCTQEKYTTQIKFFSKWTLNILSK